MTDDQFIKELLRLDGLGKDGITAMREVLRGQMSRLIALAARGAGLKEKKPRQPDEAKTHIPDGFPGIEAKNAAIDYWNKKRRPDLVARVEEIAGAFHGHHFTRNNRMSHWSIVWQTWYVREVNISKPPRDMVLAPVAEVVSLDTAAWVRRLRLFYFGDEGNGVDKGFWSAKWGPKPGERGCDVPAAALSQFEGSRQQSLGV